MSPQRAGMFTGYGNGKDRLLAWAERSGRRSPAEPCHRGVRFAFYGRVSGTGRQETPRWPKAVHGE